jgi:hypothetical protein
MFLVAGLGGWLAQIFSYQTVFLLGLIIPVISVTASFLIRIDIAPIKPINWKILGGGIIYSVFVLFMGITKMPYHQEIVFIVSLAIVIYLLKLITKDLPKKILRHIACAATVIFLFRAMPPVGPGLQWWEIDVLHFSKAFFGTLAQIGAALTIVGMWVFAKYITEKPIGLILVVLTVISFILSLPILGMYYGLHEWTQQTFGFGAHSIALVDTALASPFVQLSMIPMLTLIAIYAPRGNAATWFALMASLMNLALACGNLVSKWLNQLWVVTREVKDSSGHVITSANYTQLGHLLWVVLIMGLVIPIIAVYLFMRPDLRKKPRTSMS